MMFAHLCMLFCGRGEMVDAADLKSAIQYGCAGSSPAVRTSMQTFL